MDNSKLQSVEETRAAITETAEKLHDVQLRTKQSKCSHLSFSFGHPLSYGCVACRDGYCMTRICTQCGKEL